MALTKVSGGILDPGINVAGIVTATGFSGPFIGGGGVNAGIVTATGLDVNGNGDISGTLVVGNIGGTPTFTGDVNFNGNVSIAQTLTYADVTNIDSVGIVTAREGIKIPFDNKFLLLGASNDLSLAHTAGHSYIADTGTGDLRITGSAIRIQNAVQNEDMAVFTQNGAVELYHDNSKKLETTSSGIKVAGDIRVGNGSGLSIKNDNASETLATFNNNGAVQLYHNNAVKLQTTSTGAQLPISSGGDGVEFFNSGDIYPEIVGNMNRTLGDKFLLSLAGKWNNNHIVGKIAIETGNDTTNKDDGRITFFTAESGGNIAERLEIEPNGNVRIPADDKKLQIGASQDIQIFHNTVTGSGRFANSSYIENNTGNLFIRGILATIIGSTSGEIYAQFLKDDKCELRFDNNVKFETTSSGATVSGQLTAGTSGGQNPSQSNWATNSALNLYGSYGGGIAFNDNGNNGFVQYVESAGVIFNLKTGAVGGSLEQVIRAVKDGQVELFYNDTKRFETTNTGSKITGNLELSSTYPSLTWTDTNHNSDFRITNDDGKLIVYDITRGAHVLDFRANGDLHVRGDKAIYFGESNDLMVGHDGSSTRIEDSYGYLNIKSNALDLRSYTGSELYANFTHNGSAKLYYDGTERFATSGIGVTVTGEVAASQDFPDFRPTLDFNFAAEKKLDPRITYQRTGVASFVNEFGKIVLVGANEPRFDHDPITRESKGLLSEPTRTNLLKYSVDFASISGYNANYSAARSTLTSTTELAPDGTNTASKYVRTAGQGTGEVAIIIGNTLGLNNTSVYTSSVFVKNVGNNSTVEMVNTRASDVNDDSQFNLANGTIITEGSNNSLTTITPYPNDWYRISVTATHNNLSGYFWVRIYNQTEGSGFLLWGGQVEVGRYPTSYIPTYNNASETRGEDLVLIDETEFTDFFNTTEGTSVVHAHMPYSSTSSGLTAYSFRNSSNSNVSLSFSRDSGSDPAYHYYHDGSNSGFARASANTSNMYKGALSFKTSDLDSYVNGSLNTNTTTFTMPTVDNLRIGGVGSENQLGGHVARFMYYPVKLTNNQLATLTS